MITRRITLAASLLTGAFLLVMSGVSAQHNHSAGHGEYKDWSSSKVGNCCDDRDCGALKENEIRETATGPQVRIEGQWCPVLRTHYLTRGKSPDWSVPHACERLLCFTPRGGF